MNLGGFIVKNALRNKRRAVLTVLSVAVSLFLLVTLQVALREMTQPAQDVDASLRIAVRNKVSIATALPERQRGVIEKLPGVVAVTPLTFFGGKFKDDESVGFAQFAVDPASFRQTFVEARLPEEERAAWEADKTSCIIGKDSAERYGLKVGQRIHLIGTLWPTDLELKVAGIFVSPLDSRNAFFHQSYLDEALGNRGLVGMWWVRAESAEAAPGVIEAIDRAFRNTSAEVRAETERAFQMGFVSMWGNIRVLITSICTVVVFTLVLVTASTMSMAIRERFRELAVLKALGFRRGELFAVILAESFGLAITGAVVGAGGAWLLYSTVPITTLTAGVFPTFEVTPRIVGISFLVAALLGVVSSIAPTISVLRASVVEGLKTLD